MRARVLILTSEPTGTPGGMEHVLRELETGLARLGYSVAVLNRESGRGKLVVCNSDQTRREVQEYFGYSGETIWLPLDTIHFAPLDKLESRRKLELPETKEIGLFVGSAHPAKGFPTVRKLIDAFPEIHWCLALRGSISEDL